MRLFIPPLNTHLRLIQPWEFTLQAEDRNWPTFCALSGRKFTNSDDYWCEMLHATIRVSLPVETLLRLERIYIKQGAAAFDSVTFRVMETSDFRLMSPKRGGTLGGPPYARFWVKLADANEIDAMMLSPS